MDQFQTEARGARLFRFKGLNSYFIECFVVEDISFSTSTKGRKDWFLEQVDGSDMDNVHLFRISRKE